MSDCGVVRRCGRPTGHRGHHGGFREVFVDQSERLSPREREVVRRLALGQTWDQIVAELGITRQTVANHRASAMTRYGGGVLVDLLREIGWLHVPDGRKRIAA